MRSLAAVSVLLVAGIAHAQPVEDGTRISLFAGARYVPHAHFDALAKSSGAPVLSDSPIGPEGLASFAYAPSPQLEISLEIGYAYDHYKLATGDLVMQNIPAVATLRWFPLAGRITPVLGAGGGYMLGLVSGAPSGEKDSHAQELHVLVGVNYELSPTLWLNLEDRIQLASGDIVPIGQIQTGGNALMLGISFILEPEHDIAPH